MKYKKKMPTTVRISTKIIVVYEQDLKFMSRALNIGILLFLYGELQVFSLFNLYECIGAFRLTCYRWIDSKLIQLEDTLD